MGKCSTCYRVSSLLETSRQQKKQTDKWMVLFSFMFFPFSRFFLFLLGYFLHFQCETKAQHFPLFKSSQAYVCTYSECTLSLALVLLLSNLKWHQAKNVSSDSNSRGKNERVFFFSFISELWIEQYTALLNLWWFIVQRKSR